MKISSSLSHAYLKLNVLQNHPVTIGSSLSKDVWFSWTDRADVLRMPKWDAACGATGFQAIQEFRVIFQTGKAESGTSKGLSLKVVKMKRGEKNMICKSWTFFVIFGDCLITPMLVCYLSLEKIQKEALSSLYNLTFYYIFIKILFTAHAHFYKL